MNENMQTEEYAVEGLPPRRIRHAKKKRQSVTESPGSEEVQSRSAAVDMEDLEEEKNNQKKWNPELVTARLILTLFFMFMGFVLYYIFNHFPG